jgi:hypothetical protein
MNVLAALAGCYPLILECHARERFANMPHKRAAWPRSVAMAPQPENVTEHRRAWPLGTLHHARRLSSLNQTKIRRFRPSGSRFISGTFITKFAGVGAGRLVFANSQSAAADQL